MKPLLEFIKRHKLATVSFFFISLILLAVILFLSTREPKEEPLPVPITEQEIVEQRAGLQERLPYQVSDSLIIENIEPMPPVFRSIWTTEPLVLTFNRKIDSRELTIRILPEIPFRAENLTYDDRTIAIIPLDGWQTSVNYLIEISSDLSDEPLVFNIRREDPSPGDEEYPEIIPDEHAGEGFEGFEGFPEE